MAEKTRLSESSTQTSDVAIPGWNRFWNQIFIIICEIDDSNSNSKKSGITEMQENMWARLRESRAPHQSANHTT